MIIIKIQNTHTRLVLDAFSVTCPSLLLLLPPLISNCYSRRHSNNKNGDGIVQNKGDTLKNLSINER